MPFFKCIFNILYLLGLTSATYKFIRDYDPLFIRDVGTNKKEENKAIRFGAKLKGYPYCPILNIR